MWGIVVNFEYISKVSTIMSHLGISKNILIENYYHIIIYFF